MPYAATLAFIDSLQDDRRDLSQLTPRDRFLESLIVRKPSSVAAKVNMMALHDKDILWKVIEGRDVLAHLRQGPDTLNFEYPGWMVD
jgi:hypothetical protein